jgi:hypothetical protein
MCRDTTLNSGPSRVYRRREETDSHTSLMGEETRESVLRGTALCLALLDSPTPKRSYWKVLGTADINLRRIGKLAMSTGKVSSRM